MMMMMMMYEDHCLMSTGLEQLNLAALIKDKQPHTWCGTPGEKREGSRGAPFASAAAARPPAGGRLQSSSTAEQPPHTCLREAQQTQVRTCNTCLQEAQQTQV